MIFKVELHTVKNINAGNISNFVEAKAVDDPAIGVGGGAGRPHDPSPKIGRPLDQK